MANTDRTVVVSTRFPRREYEALERVARRHGFTVAEYVRYIVRTWEALPPDICRTLARIAQLKGSDHACSNH